MSAWLSSLYYVSENRLLKRVLGVRSKGIQLDLKRIIASGGNKQALDSAGPTWNSSSASV